MALSLASPGIKVREVDLTRGGISNTTSLSAGIAAPFAKGPVNQIVTITSENELVSIFGKPSVNDYHYESWYSASNFMAYGGSLKVVRCSGSNLRNANAGVAATALTTLAIENYADYQADYSSDSTFYWAAKNPGYWSEGLKVCVIDNFADQTLSGIITATSQFSAVTTSSSVIGATTTVLTGVTTSLITPGQYVNPVTGIIGAGTTVVSIGSSTVTLGTASINTSPVTTTLGFGTYVTGSGVQVGYGITQTLTGTVPGVGTTSSASGYIKGIVTGVGASTVYVKVTSKVVGGVETTQEYTENSIYEFKARSLNFVDSSATIVTTPTPTSTSDWYNSQYVLSTANGDYADLSWRSIAPKPRNNAYVTERGGSNDALHVVVVDSKKAANISGNPQTLLEKFTNLSKASDTTISPSQNVYYKDYLALNSQYIYAGKSLGDTTNTIWNLDPVQAKFSSGFTPVSESLGLWGVASDEVDFNVVGNKSFSLTGGVDYSGTNNIGGFAVTLANLSNAYDLFASDTASTINFLLQGSASLSKEDEQAKANKLISLAETRKDCIACISPYRAGVVNITPAATQLSNILSFFSPLTSSSYAIFDSGYQYVYDRYNQQFVYIPCSADVAGLCVRTDIDQFPWYSPAGKTRGTLKFPIKLAFNPGQDERDRLYSQRINPIISSPGSGIILFGDKTALSYQSAFDRINVRRLFITLEQAVKGAADAQLFEFNDATTRANFINIVEPYLRDVQIKRGITDFLLVCDETNNTPDVIDRNEFIADIYVKPARSINFIGLTFVATRTGVSFETVVGTV
jgi:hypothetical protein